ncbi:hypothetical protein NUH88_18435 [Nisaea acidiphila]|uniref:Uncharacterized protein n=1 Tax=Nisaea acidiphila TaxID=1862145 RepID=A0A9J7AVC3_9PROT|nr:hypothetical protein [Nisaea acidiphila]UUX49365.1 hypothetical protein NUH88_18435 [Nisaea acidiphila]
MSRRRITRHQLSVDDIATLYDTLLESQKKRYYRRWKVETPVLDARRKRDVVQDDVRLKRLEDRAEGIEFALRFDDLTYRQRKEMEQMARNLRLAAQGMKKILAKS